MSNDKAMYMRENLGIVTRSESHAFTPAFVDRLNTPSNWFHTRTAPTLRVAYVCIDPCGGGPSAMAAVAGFYTSTGHLVVRARPPVTNRPLPRIRGW